MARQKTAQELVQSVNSTGSAEFRDDTITRAGPIPSNEDIALEDSILSTLIFPDGSVARAVVLVDGAEGAPFSPSNPLPVSQVGAAHHATGHVTLTGTSTEIVPARATRRSILIRNLHATESCYVGTAPAAAATDMLLKAGESVPLSTVEAIAGIRAGSTSVDVAFWEEYDD